MKTPALADSTLSMRNRDYFSLLWQIPLILGSSTLSLLIRCSWPWHSLYSLHWRQKLQSTLLNSVTTTLNFRQQSYFISRRESTGLQVEAYCAAKGIKHQRVHVSLSTGTEIPSPALHIITLRDANPSGPTIFYAHGGGYQSPLRSGVAIPFVSRMASSCKAAKIAILEYSLTPATQYPGQFVQAVEGLRYLIDKGCAPSDIVLVGDSAGGHLIASVILHLQSPAPGLPPIDLQGTSFRAAILISPWLRMSEDRYEARVNKRYDFLHAKLLQHYANLFNPDKNHLWANPMEAHDAKSLWSKAVGQSGVVNRLLVTAGDAELLFDSCKSFMAEHVAGQTVVMDPTAKGTDLKSAIQDARAVLAIGLHEVHIQPLFDASQNYYKGGTMTAILYFLSILI
ncbi:Alpha/Beta hydrolase protein [Fusarium redolens]|uniref:Alpha/Beta hydrolase protein n=1 Tax=Fusarium redolens TaxID=48865 RepID=A0A9P9FW80_FUSRE|nr:Alpha/Beta hydrolase protein [Fusarium redolens]KAH7204869.1 Alpha/Beta hydrolase protein [Fusarium redolens]